MPKPPKLDFETRVKSAERSQKRKEALKNARPKALSAEQIMDIELLYDFAKKLSKLNPKWGGFDVDHIVPIGNQDESSEICGIDYTVNMQIIDKRRNLEKGDKLFYEPFDGAITLEKIRAGDSLRYNGQVIKLPPAYKDKTPKPATKQRREDGTTYDNDFQKRLNEYWTRHEGNLLEVTKEVLKEVDNPADFLKNVSKVLEYEHAKKASIQHSGNQLPTSINLNIHTITNKEQELKLIEGQVDQYEQIENTEDEGEGTEDDDR